MIQRLYMRNLRGIAEGELDDLAQINVFVGPNNTGKTTILEALYLTATADTPCSLAMEDGAFMPVRVSADADLLGYHPLARLWQRHGLPLHWENTTSRWEEDRILLGNLPAPLAHYHALEGKRTRSGFVAGDEQRTAMFTVAIPQGADVLKPEEGGSPIDWSAPSALVERYFGESAAPWEDRRFGFTWYPPFTYNYNGLAGWYSQGSMPDAAHTLFLDFHTTAEHLSQSLVERGYRETDDWLRRIGRHFQTVLGLDAVEAPDVGFDVNRFDPTQRIGLVERNRRLLPIDLWGDGARHVFKVLAPLLVLADAAEKGRPALLLWEDPELFLHVQALERLVREAAQIVQDKPLQVFITTQSPDIVAVLTDMLRSGQLPPESVKAYRLALTNGRLVSSWFGARNLIAWLEDGKDIRVWTQEETLLRYYLGERA
ncbi:MAG: hypothetical protein FJ011_15300 [Chloroflexi bacterium]|nr:hypothetical protein [Chloroflexota bacterium]